MGLGLLTFYFRSPKGSQKFFLCSSLAALQDRITDIRNWMIADRLKLNNDKTEFMIIGTCTQYDNVNVSEIVVGQAKVLAAMIVSNLGT